MKSKPKSHEEVTGVYSFTLFAKDGFIIGKLDDGSTVKGTANPSSLPEQGKTYRFLGRWVQDPKYGRQFQFDSVMQDYPHSRSGITSYLIDNAQGVGTVAANRLWDKYGVKAVDVLRDEPQRVVADSILRKDDAAAASAMLKAIKATEKTTIDLMDLFKGRGFPRAAVNQCIDIFGVNAPDVIRKSPFRLVLEKVRGAGFKRVDRLFLDLGGAPNDILRQTLCAWHAVKSDMSGHTWRRVSVVFDAINDTVGGTKTDPVAAIKNAIELKLLTLRNPNSNLAERKGWIAEVEKAEQEKSLAANIKRLLGWGKVEWPSLSDDAIQQAQLSECFKGKGQTKKFFMSPHQVEQARRATSLPIGMLIGGPGTGKTFTVSWLIDMLKGLSIAVCAPTGKAAVRCNAAMIKNGIVGVKATTIHSLLKWKVADNGDLGFEYGRSRPLPFKVIIIDEVSMVGVPLMASLLDACADGTHVLLVGDKGQLPPVEHGAPLRDLMDSLSSIGELTEIHRNSGMIVRACAAITEGRPFETCETFDIKRGDNLRLIERSSPESTVKTLLHWIRAFEARGLDPMSDIQVLVPVNSKSELSRTALNKLLQEQLNPNGKKVGTNPFRLNDKIICLRNTHLNVVSGSSHDASEYKNVFGEDEKPKQEYVANGEIGPVVAVSDRAIIVKFPCPDRLVRVPVFTSIKEEGEDKEEGRGGDFDLAYAVTGHKSQGSEWRAVINIADPFPGARFVSSREWWKTVNSRATEYCLIIGKMSTVEKHCQRVAIRERKTFLVELMKEIAAPDRSPVKPKARKHAKKEN